MRAPRWCASCPFRVRVEKQPLQRSEPSGSAGATRIAECLDAVARHAASTGIGIAVEPTPADSNLVETADDVIKLIAEVRQPNVKAMFDTYHALYRKTA